MSHPDPHILQFPEIVVVEASAGSGKTYALAKRFIHLLINDAASSRSIPLRSILAITFTNKAMIEMKERILELLKKIALDAFSDKEEEYDIYNRLQVSKEYARKRAADVMEEIISHYNFFQIQTIDSFINALLLGCSFLLDRSSRFMIRRDYTHTLAYCLDLVIEEAGHNSKVLRILEEFLDHYLFIEQRTGWFPKEDILFLMESFFALTNTYGTTLVPYKGESRQVLTLKDQVLSRLRLVCEDIPRGFNANVKRSLCTFLARNMNSFVISDVPLALAKGEPPMNRGKRPPARFKKRWKGLHETLIRLVELDATTAYNPYLKLFSLLIDYFHTVSSQEDVVFLAELNRKAHMLFDEEGLTIAEAYYRLATRFRHYLIDEFQDTSVLQWQNLSAMVEEALSSGGTLFYVGDKKQAIYRFRGGDARLFDSVKNTFRRYPVVCRHLRKNWRSQKAIVEFNNSIFSQENLRRFIAASGIMDEIGPEPGAESGILEVFKDAVQEHRVPYKGGYVRVEIIGEKNQQERDLLLEPKIIASLRKALKRFTSGSIAVLTRDNSEVELVTAWLLKAGFAVESDKTLTVTDNPFVKEIVSFLYFLHSPTDDIHFASFITGDIFASVSGIPKDEICSFIFSLHARQECGTFSLYRFFRERYKHLWDSYIGAFFKNVGFVPLYELVVSFYGRFDISHHFPLQQAFFMKFLELIKSKEDDSIGLSEFLAYLNDAPQEELYVNVTHSDAIKVLTIHKAKGLEFPVVIVPFLRMDINPEAGGKGTRNFLKKETDERMGLVKITKTHRMFSSVLQGIYSQSYFCSCIDELNNLYVALTRAQSELYVFIPKRSGAAENKAVYLFSKTGREKGKVHGPRPSLPSEKTVYRISPSVYADWPRFLKDETSHIDIKRLAEREKGIIVHDLLSRIVNLHEEDEARHIAGAIDETAVRFSLDDEKKSELKIFLAGILSCKKLRPFFYPSGGVIRTEAEIVTGRGDLKRVDRLIITHDEAVVVEYKMSRYGGPEQQAQVREYMDCIRDIFPTKRLRGFLLYLDEKSTDEIKA